MHVGFVGWATSWYASGRRDEEADGTTGRQQRSRHDGSCSTDVRCWNCRLFDLHIDKGTKRLYIHYIFISLHLLYIRIIFVVCFLTC